MNVVHICQSADPRIGGSLVVARALAASQRISNVNAKLLYLYESEYDDLDSSGICLGVSRSRRYTEGIKKLRSMLLDQKPDVIHHHDGLLWPRLVTARHGAPLITHGHLGAPAAKWLSLRRLVHRYISKNTDRLIAISDWVAESWVASGYPAERVRLVGNGVDTRRFHRRTTEERTDLLERVGIDPKRRVLLWAGRLHWEMKGLERLVSVLEALPADWTCVVAGDGPDRARLLREVEARASRSDDVHILGNVLHPESWFGIADAFAFTSKFEPFGLVLLEALASSLPVIAFPSDGGAMNLLARFDFCLLRDARAGSIESALQATARIKVENNRRIVADHYGWEAVAREITQIYAEVV
jgi:glycosyltransferase involved in cell wall biosynthesis